MSSQESHWLCEGSGAEPGRERAGPGREEGRGCAEQGNSIARPQGRAGRPMLDHGVGAKGGLERGWKPLSPNSLLSWTFIPHCVGS